MALVESKVVCDPIKCSINNSDGTDIYGYLNITDIIPDSKEFEDI